MDMTDTDEQQFAKLNILVIDDNPASVLLLVKFLERNGHVVNIAHDGQEGVEVFQKVEPDLVLTDINMPVMDGIGLIKNVREITQDSWVPIIVLSALSEEEDIVKALDAGADDYLPKPFNISVLNAKIKAIMRVVKLQTLHEEAIIELQKLNEEMEEEQILAKKIFDKILYTGCLEHPSVEYWLSPNKNFSGDFIAVEKSGNDRLYVLLADATGHGLSAALPTILLAKIFHSMTEKGFHISKIAEEMNKAIYNMLTPDRFVATVLLTVDIYHKSIEFWNGGIPAPMFINQAGQVSFELKSKHLAIGILSPNEFDSTTELLSYHDSGELIIYSDGLIEAENGAGEFYGVDRLKATLAESDAKSSVGRIKANLTKFMNAHHGHDDISVLSVDCTRRVN